MRLVGQSICSDCALRPNKRLKQIVQAQAKLTELLLGAQWEHRRVLLVHGSIGEFKLLLVRISYWKFWDLYKG